MAEAEKQFDLNVWMQRTGRTVHVSGPRGYENAVVRVVYPRIFCADGFHMSVQASDFHDSVPRENSGPYSAVEVGFPSEYEPLLTRPQNHTMPTGTVYPYVEVEIVEQIVVKHGGIADTINLQPNRHPLEEYWRPA